MLKKTCLVELSPCLKIQCCVYKQIHPTTKHFTTSRPNGMMWMLLGENRLKTCWLLEDTEYGWWDPGDDRRLWLRTHWHLGAIKRRRWDCEEGWQSGQRGDDRRLWLRTQRHLGAIKRCRWDCEEGWLREVTSVEETEADEMIVQVMPKLSLMQVLPIFGPTLKP